MKIGDQVILKLDGKSKRPYRIIDIIPNRVILEDIETWARWSVSPSFLK